MKLPRGEKEGFEEFYHKTKHTVLNSKVMDKLECKPSMFQSTRLLNRVQSGKLLSKTTTGGSTAPNNIKSRINLPRGTET